jgi:septal ring factor EnvC (AmiA/AmiB activator)
MTMYATSVRWVVLLLLFGGACSLRAQDELQRRQAELENLRSQIQELEKKSKQQQQNESETLDLLDTYDRKATLLRRLIRRYRSDERQLQGRIDSTQRVQRRLHTQLAFLRDHYARSVCSVYKSGRQQDAELLVTSSSVNQLTVRNEYLRRFAEQRRREADRITAKRSQIEATEALAQRQLGEERRLIAEKGAEEDRLGNLASERRVTLERIRKDKKWTERQIQRQTQAARDMSQLIARLVEADRIRSERSTTVKTLPRLPLPTGVNGEFEVRKGKLRWPVTEGNIVARFGPQKHPTLRTITQNTGIDIAVSSGTQVNAVVAGEVKVITFLPSYGNLVILDHQNGYRTVYAHLAEIEVQEGQILAEGEPIGRSGDAMEGPRLHFEVWKDREKQNPETWLTR